VVGVNGAVRGGLGWASAGDKLSRLVDRLTVAFWRSGKTIVQPLLLRRNGFGVSPGYL